MTPAEVHELVFATVAGLAGVPPGEVAADTSLEALGLDSSDAVILAMEVEERTGVELEVSLFLRCATVGEAATEIAAIVTADPRPTAG